MVYIPSIPQATDIISQSQSQILENFSQLNTLFSKDHITWTDIVNGGFHSKITFNNVQADPTLSFPQTELYTKTSPAGSPNGFNDLYYYEKNTAGTSSVIQLTGGGVTAAAWATIVMNSGTPTIPSGGSYNVASVTQGTSDHLFTITFSRPFETTAYSIQFMVDLSGTSGINTAGYFISSKSEASVVVQVRASNSAQIFSGQTLYMVCYGTLA